MLLDRENFQYILWHPSDLSSTKSKTTWYLWKFDILGLSPTKTKTCLSKHIVPNEAFVVDIQSIILQEAPEAKKVKSRTNKSKIEINVTFTRCCSFSNEDQNGPQRGFIKKLRWPALRIALLYVSHELPKLLATLPGSDTMIFLWLNDQWHNDVCMIRL